MSSPAETRWLESPELWVEIHDHPRPSARPALFLDRDGTVMEDSGYPRRAEDVRLVAHILPAIRAANAAGTPVVLVTNQSGIARGLLAWRDFAAVQARLVELLAHQGCALAAVLACGAAGEHPMRKPNPGMLLLAIARLHLDPGRSLIVGDKPSDLEAGAAAGLAHGFLIGAQPPAPPAPGLAATPITGPADWARLAACVRACGQPR